MNAAHPAPPARRARPRAATVTDGRFRATGSGPAVPGACRAARCRIAALSNDEIAAMDREDLVQLIRSAGVPPGPADILQRLDYMRRADLERLAFLVRHGCRNQIGAFATWLGAVPASA